MLSPASHIQHELDGNLVHIPKFQDGLQGVGGMIGHHHWTIQVQIATFTRASLLINMIDLSDYHSKKAMPPENQHLGP
jgi:hypothetical protein